MNTNTNFDGNVSTPSLVGGSVRSVNDLHNPDFNEQVSSNLHPVRSSHVLNKINSQPNLADASYTSVAELNREGALLTDEVDLDQVINATEQSTDDTDKQRKMQALKQKRQMEMLKQRSRNSINSSSASIHSTPSAESRYLVTSTDPVDDQINVSGPSGKHRRGLHSSGAESNEDSIRNSYGEFIKSKCHRPHLAGGESYQSSHDSEFSDDRGEERAGRRSRRSLDNQSSTEYLRSISRSLSRDPARKRGPTGDVSDVTEKLNNARLYSTNNYSISQADLENAPHIIEQTLEEEQEDEEEEGALMDDQGNEEYDKELENAADDAEARHP
ncbi:uncharacterized protein TDEL_0B06280 [Torulaspora delbrueckii]|uniref:Uncharacterized protein n=1 Tax=Torulaspora delbrueckii TaxID=4950 RepID=G8ZQ63_TORDE|nr:hypothetical protein TDEL_0B06280 [Torulaspora delbrueckii]CCE90757.1 hypothetical protein TDEL_0B06280 [Torulaspora delbrueckii]